jgi:hypothetical protein
MAAGDTITTLSLFRDYIKRQLGHPVICVEIADEQLDEVIRDTIDIFQRYMYSEGTYKDWMIMSVSAGTSAYTMPDNVQDVLDIKLSAGGGDGINSLFTPTHNLLSNDWVGNGAYPGGPGGGGTGMSLAGYDVAMMYLEEIRLKFSRLYRLNYRDATKELLVTPTPNEDMTGVVEVYKRHAADALYNHILVRKLAVALSKKLWALHLKKYNLTLPGGGNLNGEGIYNDGLTEEEKVMDMIIKESQPPDFYVG